MRRTLSGCSGNPSRARRIAGSNTSAAHAGLTCSEVSLLAPAMMMKKFPAEKVQQIEEHVTLCPNCQELFKNMTKMSKEMG